jgi:hypothetical protein
MGPDFCLVQLTVAGVAFAKSGPLRVSNGRVSVTFPADNAPQKVANFEWDMLLRDHTTADGNPLFEIVQPAAAAAAPPAKTATPKETK